MADDSDDPIFAGTEITARFRFAPFGADLNNDAALADPSIVTVSVKNPAGESTSYVYGTDEEVVRDGAGRYSMNVLLSTAGRWTLRGVGSVGGPIVAIESTIDVISRF